jgi:hypothetical protein
MAAAPFEAFRQHVLADRALQDELLACGAPVDAFAREAADLATAHGFPLTEDDVERAIADARHEWLLRWV